MSYKPFYQSKRLIVALAVVSLVISPFSSMALALEAEIEGTISESPSPSPSETPMHTASASYSPSPTPTDEASETHGSITVCKLIVDAQGNVSNGQELSGITFTETAIHPVAGDTTASSTAAFGPVQWTTPLTFNTDLVNDNTGPDANCVTFNHLALGDYYYDEEVISGAGSNWLTPFYNDQYQTQVTSLGSFFNYDARLFDNDPLNDPDRILDADGHITLIPERPDRTLVILNRLPERFIGKMTVCKIATEGTSGAIFTIPGLHPMTDNDPDTIDSTYGFPDSTFTTPLVHNADILFGDATNDAQCQSYENLPLGSYYHGQEVVSSSYAWAEPLYNDTYDYTGDPLNLTLTDFFPWSGELYDADPSNNAGRNLNADGHVSLTEARPQRTLIVYNKLSTATSTPTPTPNPCSSECSSSTPTPSPTPTPSTGGGGGGVGGGNDGNGVGGGTGGTGGGGGGGVSAPTATATPSPTPDGGVGGGTEEEVLGASTVIPATGFGDIDGFLMALFAGLIVAGATLATSGPSRKASPKKK